MRVVSANLAGASDERVLSDLRTLIATGADVIACQEAGDRSHVLAATGWTVWRGVGAGAPATPVLVSPDAEILDKRTVPLTAATDTGPKMVLLRNVWRKLAGPTTVKPKVLNIVTLATATGPVSVASCHGPASVWAPRRRALSRVWAQGIATHAATLDHPLLPLGDFNTDPASPILQPLRDSGMVCDHAVLGKLRTHGRATIDQAWSLGVRPIAHRTLATSSDHAALVVDYPLTLGEPAPPAGPARTAAAHGIDNAISAVLAAQVTGLPLPAAFALLEKESGGRNVYGHDRGGVFSEAGLKQVTEANFREFRHRVVDRGETSNGVGPCQITYRGYFAQMESEGLRPWVPLDNMKFGFAILRRNHESAGSWDKAGTLFNAGNLAGGVTDYGRDLAAKVAEWTTRLDLDTPGPTPQPPQEDTVATSQNGWPALASDSSKLYTWTVPAKNGAIRIRLRNGSAGFLLVHFLMWFSEHIEPLAGKVVDDWGYAFRSVRGSETDLSNHASGTAADHNAPKHPLGVRGTFTTVQYARIRAMLRLRYKGRLRHGIDYQIRADEMHVEINASLSACEDLARKLMTKPAGQRILQANPGQEQVINS